MKGAITPVQIPEGAKPFAGTGASAEAVTEADLTPLEFAVMAYVNSTDGEPDLDQSALAVPGTCTASP